MKFSIASVVLLGAATVWVAIANPWVVPGVALFLVCEVLNLLAVGGAFDQRMSLATFALTRLLLRTGAIIYLVALAGGDPTRRDFWIILGVAIAIFAPVIGLAHRLLFPQSFRRSA